jgi:hypothetical protein
MGVGINFGMDRTNLTPKLMKKAEIIKNGNVNLVNVDNRTEKPKGNKEEKLRIDAKVEYPFNSSVKARECFIDAVKSDTAREYWKETLHEESKQNAIEFGNWKIKNEIVPKTTLEGKLEGEYLCRGNLFYGLKTETELYDLFIKHKEESK